ncbi:MAG: aspartate kinase [Treponema sp.]|jgi:aspartate kinase|nr:aspartate kinase [Treponema sp.]
MIVMKFGGSSVANAERIKHVAAIIAAYRDKKPIVVLSAMGDTTDHLLEAADAAVAGSVNIDKIRNLQERTQNELSLTVPEIGTLLDELVRLLTGISMIKELTKRTRDYVVSFGERMSVRMMAAFLNKNGIAAAGYDSWDVGFLSNSCFMSADLEESVWSEIPKHFKAYAAGTDGAVPVVTGFIAHDKDGNITTLGRGGSDLSATMIGAAVGADEIQTWKDVDGIMTGDPRVCRNARMVPEVTYDEAQELATFGAQVLHPRSMIPCRKTGTPVRVKNSYNIKSPGSIIVEKHTAKPNPVCAVTSVKHVTLIDIVSTRMLGASGFLAHIFNQFLKWNISIDVIATSEVSVSLTINCSDDLTGLIQDLERVADVRVKKNKAIVAIICDAAHSSSILAKGFAALAEDGKNVQMISQGASKVNISFLCDEAESDHIIQILHKAYFE